MNPQKKTPTGKWALDATAALGSARSNYSGIDELLSRLDGVRKSGRGFTAKCPAHQDRTASLAVSEGTDGRILLHCFSGCSALQVVHALGMEMSDLFPRRIETAFTREDRRALSDAARMSRWKAALAVLAREATLVETGAVMAAGGLLGPEDVSRLHVAAQRIRDAWAVMS